MGHLDICLENHNEMKILCQLERGRDNLDMFPYITFITGLLFAIGHSKSTRLGSSLATITVDYRITNYLYLKIFMKKKFQTGAFV